MPACRGAAWEKGITHTQRVSRLYRASLRTARDWIIDYEAWVKECVNIQSRFRTNKNKSLIEGKHLVEQGMDELFSKRHPEPYIPIYASDGSSHQRNVPPPPEVSYVKFSHIFCNGLFISRMFSVIVTETDCFVSTFLPHSLDYLDTVRSLPKGLCLHQSTVSSRVPFRLQYISE